MHESLKCAIILKNYCNRKPYMVTDIRPAASERQTVRRNPVERFKRIGRSVHQITGIGLELMRERAGEPRYVARELTTEDEITEARKLATVRFEELGKIGKERIHQEGELRGLPVNDPLFERSTFFGVYEGDTLLATARFVWGRDMTVRDTRMPFERLPAEMTALLDNIPRGESAEFASLAKIRGASNAATLKLIREMVHWAYEHDVKYFTSGLEPRVYPLYKTYFGGAVTRLHPRTVVFPGIQGDQVPIIVDLGDTLDDGFEKQARGDEKNLGARMTELAVRAFLRSGYETEDAE